jgi:hypothetical protein
LLHYFCIFINLKEIYLQWKIIYKLKFIASIIINSKKNKQIFDCIFSTYNKKINKIYYFNVD